MATATFLQRTITALLILHLTTARMCHPGCRCFVENFGLFHSFSLTKVDCTRVGPNAIPISIPLQTSSLDLSYNRIRSIEGVSLSGQGYATLSGLNLSNNLISTLNGSVFSRLHYLETLDLSRNSIESLAGGFSGLPLAEIDLSHNRIGEIDLSMFAIQHRGRPPTVDLSRNDIRSVMISESSQPLNIQSLNLAGNELTLVPKLQDISLRYLNLADNPIMTINEESFSGLKDLTHLFLNRMPKLHAIKPRSLRDLRNLQVLDLSDNSKLTSLSAEVFRGLRLLQELDVSNCGFRFLPANVLELLPGVKSIVLGDRVKCRRIHEQELFHRNVRWSDTRQALICDRPLYREHLPGAYTH